jgi:hypothetical protein
LKKNISFLTMITTALFVIMVIITFLFPEILTALHLGQVEARTIIMNLISLILILTFMQTQLSLSWRIFCLVASFVVLIEAILMLGVWQQFIK